MGDGKAHEIPATYPLLLSELKDRIRTARLKAALAVNSEMVLLYWSIGRDILEKQRTEHWGTKMVERLSRDLRGEFPDNKGLSPRNLLYMRLMAEAYPEERFVQQLVAQIPWGHNVVILDKIKEASPSYA